VAVSYGSDTFGFNGRETKSWPPHMKLKSHALVSVAGARRGSRSIAGAGTVVTAVGSRQNLLAPVRRHVMTHCMRGHATHSITTEENTLSDSAGSDTTHSMAPLRRYLRITRHSVLEVRIYLDRPADAEAWLLKSGDPALPRVMKAVQPLVLPKLREENERGKGKGSAKAKKTGVKDVVVEGELE